MINEAQTEKFKLENRAIELEKIKKAKSKLKFKGHYCYVIKYCPDFLPKNTKIFIPDGKDEATKILTFVEKRSHYHPNFKN
jgi:hypothetical protein